MASSQRRPSSKRRCAAWFRRPYSTHCHQRRAIKAPDKPPRLWPLWLLAQCCRKVTVRKKLPPPPVDDCPREMTDLWSLHLSWGGDSSVQRVAFGRSCHCPNE